MHKCEEFRGRLEKYYEGRLDPIQEQRMEAHRKDCSSCQEAYAEMFKERFARCTLFGVWQRHSFQACLCEDTLLDLLAKRLGPQEAEYVQTHEAGCFSCHFRLEGLRTEVARATPDIEPARPAVKGKIERGLGWARGRLAELIEPQPQLRPALATLSPQGGIEVQEIKLRQCFDDVVLEEQLAWAAPKLSIDRYPTTADRNIAEYVVRVERSSLPDSLACCGLRVVLTASDRKAEILLTSRSPNQFLEGDGLPSDWNELAVELRVERKVSDGRMSSEIGL